MIEKKQSLIKSEVKDKYINLLSELEKKLNKYSIIVIAVIVLIIAIFSSFITAYFPATYENAIEKTDYKNDNIIISIVFVFIALAIIYALQKIMDKIKIKYILAIFLTIFLIVSIMFCIHIKIGPIADQGFMIAGGEAVLARAMSSFVEPGGYLDMFPYQYGYITYSAVVLFILRKLKFFTDILKIDIFIYFQILNAIYNIANMVLLYLISKKIFKDNKNVQKIVTLLIIGFSPYLLFFNTHIYGNIPGFMFSLIAIYFTILYLENRKLYNIIIAGIAISGAIILKSNFEIFLCGIIIILIMDILKKIELKKCLMIFIIFAIFAFSQFGINKLSGRIAQRKPSDGVPMISYIYMGMAPSNSLSSGWYTADVIEIYNRSNHNTEEAIKETKRLMEERITHFKEDPKEAKRYFLDKIKSTWLNPTFQTIWIITPGSRCIDPNYAKYISERPDIIEMVNYNSNFYKFEESYFNIYQIVIFIFAGMSLIKIRKDDNIEKILLPVIFLGGLLFHILWETKSIYVIWYYYILLPYAAHGICIMFDYIKEKKILKKL